MRVLVINQHFWPEIAATAQILTDLCEDIAAAGHQVTVLCGQPSYRSVEGMEKTLPIAETHHGVQIRRLWNYAPEQRTIPRRLLHYGSFFSVALARSLISERPDVLLVLSTPPLLLGVVAETLRLFRDVPFVYSVQDLYPDIAIDLGVLNEGPLTRAMGMVADHLYRRAATVVTLSDAMASRLLAKGIEPSRLSVIPNWTDTDAVVPLSRDNAVATSLGVSPDRFTVQYSGNIGMSQGLEVLPECAERLRDVPVALYLVGAGNARQRIEEEVARRGLPNVRFAPPQPRAKLPELLAACDVGLVTMKRGIASNLVPSKLYGIMGAARPVLAAVDAGSEVANVVNRFQCGLVVSPEDPAALAGGIRRLFEQRDRLPAMGKAAREACEAMYSRRRCTAQYLDVLERLGTSNPTPAYTPPPVPWSSSIGRMTQ